MTNAICSSTHRSDLKFDKLPEAQSGEARHKCCGCAYEQGLKDGRSGHASNPTPSEWKTSQAQSVRHKDSYEAYKLGYNDGKALFNA